MSKLEIRLASVRGLRWLFGPGVFALSCHPEAGSTPQQCRTAADCGDAGDCRRGRCTGVAAGRAADAPTAAPVSVAQTEPERRPGEGPLTAPAERWAVDLGAVISARPALTQDAAGNVVAYVGSHAGRFVGVGVEGPTAGQIALDLWVDGIIWSSAVADPRGWLYFGADDDHLYAVDPKEGAIAWKRRMGQCEPPRAPGPEGIRCDVDGGPTLAPDGDLYVGADGLYRISTEGELRWHYPEESDDPAAHVATAPLSTPDGVVYGNYAKQVVALDHDGTLRWTVTLGADVDGSPAAGKDGVVYVGSDDGSLYAIDRAGVLVWSFETKGEVRAAPLVGPDGAVVVASYDDHVYVLESTGVQRFKVPTSGPIHAPLGIDTAGRVYVGSRDEHLYSIDLDGHVHWKLELPDQIDSGAVVSPGGTIVLGCDDGILRGLR